MQIVRISLSNSKFLKVNDNDLYSFYCPFSGLDLTGEEVDPKLYPKNLLCHLLMNEVEEPIYANKEIKKHLKKFEGLDEDEFEEEYGDYCDFGNDSMGDFYSYLKCIFNDREDLLAFEIESPDDTWGVAYVAVIYKIEKD